MTRQIITHYMSHALNQDETLTKTLIPDFPVGCRRMTPGVGYLAALTKPNVQAVTTEIEEICPEGIKLVNGELIAVDAIVCATGFNLTFVPGFPIIGASGNLQDIWRDSVPAAYMSCMVPGMPNYFSKSTFLTSSGFSCI
jgi:cation diffusion facilitator CzcD-associated flavoprotein CzcO